MSKDISNPDYKLLTDNLQLHGVNNKRAFWVIFFWIVR